MSDSNSRKTILFWPKINNNNNIEQKEILLDKRVIGKIVNGTRSGSEDAPIDNTFYYRSLLKQSYTMPERLFKVIVVGDPTVGKTAFVQRYVSNVYKKEFKGTVGVDFALKILTYSEYQTVKLQLWDIAGQERFTWMTRVYYKDAHGCIIMFDLTNRTSFLNTLKWKRDVDSKCNLPNGRNIPCMLLGNKCDLPSRQIEQMEIETFARENNFIGWTEVSAKEGLMVNDSMKFLVDTMLKQDVNDMETVNGNSDSLRLNTPEKELKKNRGSCMC